MEKSRRRRKRKREEKHALGHTLLTILGSVVCIALIPILILNISLIIKSYVKSDEVPNVGGYLPLIVLTDSMYPNIQSGDLIICHTSEPEAVAVGDVIAFFDPAGNGTSVVTHRVIEITEEEGGLAFRTQGDANNAPDQMAVPADNLVGVYRSRIAGAGRVAMFMQTTAGLIICVVVPLLLLIGYDMIRRRIYERDKKEDADALRRELEELRAQQKRKNSRKKSDE